MNLAPDLTCLRRHSLTIFRLTHLATGAARDKVWGVLTRFSFYLLALCMVGAVNQGQAASDPWKADEVVQSDALVKVLETRNAPAIFMVGPRILYNGNHIRGALFAGPCSKPEGIALLQQQAAKLSKSAAIVLYCGCCPMEKCPNIRPAFEALQRSGFTNVKILEIPTNLPTDWTEKSYPVEKGTVAIQKP